MDSAIICSSWYFFVPSIPSAVLIPVKKFLKLGAALLGQLIFLKLLIFICLLYTSCVHIPLGKGVCGTAFVGNRTELAEDVLAFPGHIACDSASRSEIVIPLHDGGGMPIGVLDIDSPVKSRFDRTDRRGLEKIAGLLEKVCQWNG